MPPLIIPNAFYSKNRRFFVSLLYLFEVICLQSSISVGQSIDEILEKGTNLLSSGQLSEALSVYNTAVVQDPNNSMAHYKRGTAYLVVGKPQLALSDFISSIKLNPDFIPSVKMKAYVFMLMGKFKESKEVYSTLTDDSESSEKIKEIEQTEILITEAESLYNNQYYKESVAIIDELVQRVKFYEYLHELRGLCYLKLGDTKRGIQELRFGTHLINDNRAGLLRISQMMYDAGLATQAVTELSQCLRLDQDDKPCSNLYKKVKNLAKVINAAEKALEAQEYQKCVDNALKITKFESTIKEYEKSANDLLCACYANLHVTDGIEHCESAVRENPDNIELKFHQAESYMSAERYEDAISIYQKIMDKDSRNSKASEGIKKAQNLLKAKGRRDYYKILGLSRRATKSEILKAYRKLAAENHPDKFHGDMRRQAEAKFLDITAAKEVLSDEKKRAQFDKGIDPLDPEQQTQFEHPFRRGSPFGGFPFDGHFEFHFG